MTTKTDAAMVMMATTTDLTMKPAPMASMSMGSLKPPLGILIPRMSAMMRGIKRVTSLANQKMVTAFQVASKVRRKGGRRDQKCKGEGSEMMM